MAKRHIPEAHVSHPNVTPLIDIVMCLIIFFMLVAKIGVTSGADAAIDIPPSVVGTDIKDMGNTLTLNVRPGAVDAPQVTALIGGELKPTELDQKQLVATLKKYKKQNEKFKVIVRAEAEMAFRFLEPVLEACANAGVTDVNFNTKIVKTPSPSAG